MLFIGDSIKTRKALKSNVKSINSMVFDSVKGNAYESDNNLIFVKTFDWFIRKEAKETDDDFRSECKATFTFARVFPSIFVPSFSLFLFVSFVWMIKILKLHNLENAMRDRKFPYMK